MKHFKGYPICAKHEITYRYDRGCPQCKKEECQCKGKRTVSDNKCKGCGKIVKMKKVEEVLEDMQRKGIIPNDKDFNNIT